MSFLGSSTIGENFNPAKDCSDIVDNLPEAKDGFYWIKLPKGKLSKVFWCPNYYSALRSRARVLFTEFL